MNKWILCAILGNVIALSLPVLPPYFISIGLSVVIMLIIPVTGRLYVLSVLLGFIWTVGYSDYQLHQRIPALWQGKTVRIEGNIISIPDINRDRARFMLQTQQACIQTHCQSWHRTIQLSWYGEHPPLIAGQHWQLDTRLKRGRGLLNPVGLDYTAYLLQAHIAATGYVTMHGNHQMLLTQQTMPVLQLRAAIHRSIEFHIDNPVVRGLVKALAIGVKADISPAQWKILQQTGTNHLLAISGLHIGMIAGMCFFVGQFFWRCCGRFMLYLPAKKAGAIFAIMAALSYSALAGFSISTQRALIMLSFAMGAVLFSRKISLTQLLIYAWFVILIYNPLGLLSRGFCLSFLAVFILNFGLGCRVGRGSSFSSWIKAQWLICIGMLPLGLLYFQQFSLIALLANAIAIPLVGFIIVPFILLSCVCQWVLPNFVGVMWYIVEKILHGLWFFLEKMADLSQPLLWHPYFSDAWRIALVLFAVILLLLPRGFPGRYLAWFGILPLFLPNVSIAPGEAKVTLLDVGQGLSVLVQTQHHTFLYDTGPRFLDSDSGGSVIIPYLHHQSIRHIDRLMVSHMDLDHRGGVESIMQNFPVNDFVTSEPSFYRQYQPHDCYRGQQWQWDGVMFTVLFPPKQWEGSRNDRSCVIRVEANKDRLLLTGDIERQAEKFLIENEPAGGLSARILLVPHHGSKTSSSMEFITHVHPEIGLIANGYRNRYRLPHQAILQRYQQQQVAITETANEGAIEFVLGNPRKARIKTYRQVHRHFWHEAINMS
jgi:competence protein ComEC